MTHIRDIYHRFPIPNHLQLHQLRVAAVAQVICDQLNPAIKINRSEIISACLLHDMGNLIKFKLDQLPELLEPQGRDYWHIQQQQFIAEYGPNEHQATLAIAKSLGVNETILALINAIGFNQAVTNSNSQDFSRKICAYADMRVGPFQVISLSERLADIRRRYNDSYQSATKQRNRQIFEQALKDIELQIQAKCSLDLTAITEQRISDTIETLKLWQI